MEKGRNNTILLTVIGIATLLVAIVGATFAYFTAIVSGNETGSTIVIRSSSGGTSVFHGAEVTTVNNIYPKGTTDSDPWGIKTVYLTYNNANALNAYNYYLTLHYTNSFPTGQIYYSFTNVTNYCDNDGTKISNTGDNACAAANWKSATATTLTAYNSLLETSGTLDNTGTYLTKTLGQASISSSAAQSGITHAYVLKIAYPNSTSSNQNAGQADSVSAYITITEIPTANS